MALPEFWYEATTSTQETSLRERLLCSHVSMLGMSVLLFTLLIAALFVVN